ncbi:MAG: sulfatase [Synoicihabitans sp.]
MRLMIEFITRLIEFLRKPGRLGLLFSTFFIGSSFSEQPNIVIIFNDDQGYQDLGCFGSPDIKTPRVDQMAREGMRFTDFYVASPVCSASRAALLTGKYPQRVGVRGVFFPNRGVSGLDPKHVTIAETLRSVGYATAAVGKWHLGDHPNYLPTNQGFDSYYGIPYSNDMSPARDMVYAANCLFREGQSLQTLQDAFNGELRKGSPRSLNQKVPLMRNEECIEFPVDQSTITKRYADEGIKFISQSVRAKKPFFLYLANSMPHTPLFASPEFKGKSERGAYGDTIEEIDFNTGRILDHLAKVGVEENTIVIFTSDNGPWLVKQEDSGSALPLFEGKFTSFEGGCRVPFIIKWPAKIPADTTSSAVAGTIDLHPTLARLAGAGRFETDWDGKDISPLWFGKPEAKSPHQFLFMVQRGEAVRSGPWKYHRKMHFTTMAGHRPQQGAALYNLHRDIGETTNLIDQHPEVANELAEALENHLERIRNQN